mgnify:CR=1 FL=1
MSVIGRISVAMAIFGFLFSLICALVGIPLSAAGKPRSPNRREYGMATAGIACGAVGLFSSVVGVMLIHLQPGEATAAPDGERCPGRRGR